MAIHHLCLVSEWGCLISAWHFLLAPVFMPPPFSMWGGGGGGHIVHRCPYVRLSVPYVTLLVSMRYLLKGLVYWIEILYTGI